jgi:hypothetical protein
MIAMSTVELIIETLKQIPEDRQREVLDFAEFLGGKIKRENVAGGGLDLKTMRLSGWPKDCTFRREDLYGEQR